MNKRIGSMVLAILLGLPWLAACSKPEGDASGGQSTQAVDETSVTAGATEETISTGATGETASTTEKKGNDPQGSTEKKTTAATGKETTTKATSGTGEGGKTRVISSMKKANGKSYIEYKGQPYLLYAVQIRTDEIVGRDLSAGSLNKMRTYFIKAKEAGFTSVVVHLPWFNLEVERDQYVFNMLDKMLEFAAMQGQTIQLVWAGSNLCSWHNLPDYIKNDTATYPRASAHKDIIDYSGKNLVEREKKALAAVMDHLAKNDQDGRVACIQVENEADHAGPLSEGMNWNNASEKKAKLWAGAQRAAILSLINELGLVVKNSDYRVVTRHNLTESGQMNDIKDLVALPGLDIAGIDSYSFDVGTMQNLRNQEEVGGNIPHQPEGGGQIGNLVNAILGNFEVGGGHMVYELRTIGSWRAYDLGIYRKSGNWVERDGSKQVSHSLDGKSLMKPENKTADIRALGRLISKADKHIALCTAATAAAFNKANKEGAFEETLKIAGHSVGYKSPAGGEAFGMQIAGGDVILMALKASSSFTLEDVKAGAKASKGYFNAANQWVEDAAVTLQGKTVVLAAGEVVRIPASAF